MKPEEYSTAIIKLLPTALGNTGGSRVAAQVLLSAYNGNAFQLDIVDLCNLDKEHYAAALGVIRGRVELGIEPHTLVNNGDKIFEDLWLKWERYHVTNRGIPDCYFCYGTGMVYADETEGDELKQCPECDGKGFVLDNPQR